MNGPACAHRHIEYRRVDHEGGTCSDSWVCRDCGAGFIPELGSDRRECIALRSLIHRISPRAMHAHDNCAGLPRNGWYEDTEGGSRYHVFEVCSESVGREMDELRAELERVRSEKCSVCAGDGKPLSGGACVCGGTGRAVDEIAGVRVEALRARQQLAALVDALPGCQQRNEKKSAGPGESLFCDKTAFWGTVSHSPEYCDEHKPANYNRECDWADTVRSLASPAGGEGE